LMPIYSKKSTECGIHATIKSVRPRSILYMYTVRDREKGYSHFLECRITYGWPGKLQKKIAIKRTSGTPGFMRNTFKILYFLGTLIIYSNPSHADSTAAQNLKLAYDIFIGDFLTGSVNIEVDTELKRYMVKSQLRSHGLLDFLFEYRGQNKVVGRIFPQDARPDYYEARGSWAGKQRTVDIRYDLAGRLIYKAVPPAAEDDRDLVPAKLLPGTADPVTAMFAAFTRASRSTTCNDQLKIFDGRRRYNIYLSEVAGSNTKGPLYSGSARVCRARQTVLAGASRRIWLPQFARPDRTDIWIASIRPDLPLLPVRIKADLGIADLVAHLVAIGGRKVPPGETLGQNAASEENQPGQTNSESQQ